MLLAVLLDCRNIYFIEAFVYLKLDGCLTYAKVFCLCEY